jgi:N-succinyldiaminopimelate aminotransferase
MTTTIFETMSGLCRDWNAINLGQGFPDMPEPAALIEAAQRALAGHSNQYPPMRGLPTLREAIAGYYAADAVLPEEVIVTSGATEALASAILALVAPGDEVICIQPLYDAYLPLIARAGASARLISLQPPHWTLDLAELAAAITDKTRLIIINTPNNPTGTMLDYATLQGIGALAQRHDLIVLSDEVWEATMLDGSAPISALSVPALRDRCVKIGSAGKIFSLTGWKIGWAVAAPALAARIAQTHQFITFTTPTPLQWAVAEGLDLGEAWFAAHRARYAASKAQLVAGLAAAGFAVLPCAATWFVIVDLAASGLVADDQMIAQRLVHDGGIGSIPVSAFYAQDPERGYLRLCHAKQAATLAAAIDRLAQFRHQH